KRASVQDPEGHHAPHGAVLLDCLLRRESLSARRTRPLDRGDGARALFRQLVFEPFDHSRLTAMTHMNTFRSRIEWRIVSSALLAAMAVAGVSDAGQPPALLAISSPSDGAIARPGQALSVTVTSPANAQFEGVAVVGEGPIGETDLVTSLPAQFSLA